MEKKYLHRPDVHFGAIFFPCKEFWGCVGWAATLCAKWVRVSQDSGTVAQAKICKQRPSFYNSPNNLTHLYGFKSNMSAILDYLWIYRSNWWGLVLKSVLW